MKTNPFFAVAGTLTVLLAAAVLFMILFFRVRDERDEARKNLARICDITKASLELTSNEIKTSGPDKAVMIGRIFGITDGTGRIVLGGCTPNFDRDVWMSCVEKSDDACMIKMLNDAAASIP